jgi:hypothetical protein
MAGSPWFNTRLALQKRRAEAIFRTLESIGRLGPARLRTPKSRSHAVIWFHLGTVWANKRFSFARNFFKLKAKAIAGCVSSSMIAPKCVRYSEKFFKALVSRPCPRKFYQSGIIGLCVPAFVTIDQKIERSAILVRNPDVLCGHQRQPPLHEQSLH